MRRCSGGSSTPSFARRGNSSASRTGLRNPNDYVVPAVRQSIVIQNFAGDLRAFHNVCSHRQSRIRSESLVATDRCAARITAGRTTAPGSRSASPTSRCSMPPISNVSDLSLDRFAVDTCGSLLFVRIDENGPSLRDYLAGAYDICMRSAPPSASS